MINRSFSKKFLIAATLAATTAPILWIGSKFLLCPDSRFCDLLFSTYTFIAAATISCIGIYYYIKFNEYSIKDLATGTYSKNFFFDTMSHEIDKAKRYKEPLTIIIFSLDNFKKDIAQHNLDHTSSLQTICKKIFASIRTSDIFSSVGNDKFALLLPQTSLDGSRTLANRLGKLISEFYSQKGIQRHMEVAFGLSDLQKTGRETPDRLYKAAAMAHVAAKNSIRNKVLAYGDPGMQTT